MRWSAAVQALPVYNDGLPLGYSNSQKTGTTCDYRQFKAGSFCPGGAGINGYHVMPASGTAFHGKYSSTTHEVKFVSDLDGMFNFLIGAIDISNNTHSYYDVYASGITLNGLMLPETIAGQYREGVVEPDYDYRRLDFETTDISATDVDIKRTSSTTTTSCRYIIIPVTF